MKHLNKKLFSLIELLVVLAILAGLVSLLSPALQKTLTIARIKVCSKQLQQLGAGVFMYTEDNIGFLPMGQQHEWHWRWAKDKSELEKALKPYLFSEKADSNYYSNGDSMYACPASPVRWSDDDNRYYHEEEKGGAAINTYEGLYYSYVYSTANTRDFPIKSDKPLLLNTYSRMMATPFQFCSRRLSPSWKINGRNNTLAAASWHAPGDLGPRPTLFLDGHVRPLQDPKYTQHGSQRVMLGPYNSYQLGAGTGVPAHDPFDFWLDEF